MVIPVVKNPNDILRVHTTDMSLDTLKTEEIQQLANNMIDTMYATQGIGIAAVQVGQDLRMCIIGKEADASLTDDLVLVNPTWEKTSRKKKKDEEGCLSIPNVFGDVVRWTNIHVEALDRHGTPLSFDAKGFFARVIQHEVDHLNGVLFIDTATNIREMRSQ